MSEPSTHPRLAIGMQWPNPLPRSRWRWVLSVTFASIMAFFPTAVWAAQRIFFFIGPLEFSVQIDALEAFAQRGAIDDELQFYLNRADVESQAAFREALTRQFAIDPLKLTRFFNTPLGEDILTRMGQGINLPSGGNGKYAIRAALTAAAFEPEGLTILNVLSAFPTDIRLNTQNLVSGVKELERAIAVTEQMFDRVAQLSSVAASRERSVNFSTLPDLRQPGDFGVVRETWKLTDPQRDRQFRVLLYKPERWRAGNTPVVVFSHGLASNPEDLTEHGAHLASYGYLVAIPQHPASDTEQLLDVLAGYDNKIFPASEFIDRPRDVSYVLDELERRNVSEFGGRLDLDNVGVVGHSFGGYTVLALAGAQIDFDRLQATCGESRSWNVSLLLQCRALQLPRKTYSFRDRRVAAAIAVNPVNSNIFGSQGLAEVSIPVMLAGGSLDPATPAIYEQLRSFPWLGSAEKYLILAEGQAHVDFSRLDAGISRTLNSFSQITLPSPDLLNTYGNAMLLAFFQVYVAENSEFLPYLQSSYASYLSQNPFGLFLIDESQVDTLIHLLVEAELFESD